MNFISLLVLDLIIAVPTMLFYYREVIMKEKLLSPRERHSRVLAAYELTAFTIAYMPLLLVYYLYINIMKYFPMMFFQTFMLILILITIFEYINYYSYLHYEKK